jgi:hypothetical protein
MLELNIKCESLEEARVYLNAQQYLNLISDLCAELRNARKHGTDETVVKVVDNFMTDLMAAVDNSDGAY